MSSRLIDTYARSFDITETQVALVDAQPATVAAALERLPLSGPATAAMDALGIAGWLAAGPAQLATRGRYERVYGLVWQLTTGTPVRLEPQDIPNFEEPGHVKVIWDVEIAPGAHDGAVLSSTRRFLATDDPARASLLTAWGLVGAVSAVLSRRALATLRSYAEELDEPALDAQPAEVLRLAA